MNIDVLNALTWYVAFLVSTTLHEAAHAWTAWRLGDDTAARHGLATLNPWPHMRFAPLGMVVVPLLALLYTGMMLGWGGCPLDPRWMFAYPRRAAVVALAGPAANLLIAVGACVAYRAAAGAGVFVAPGNGAANAGWAAGLEHMLLVLALLNGILLLFNMIPVPPFDGANLVLLFLPPETGRAYLARLHEPNAQLFGQLIAFGVLAPHVCRWASMAVSWALFGW